MICMSFHLHIFVYRLLLTKTGHWVVLLFIEGFQIQYTLRFAEYCRYIWIILLPHFLCLHCINSMLKEKVPNSPNEELQNSLS